MAGPRVTVVIPTYNRASRLPGLVASLEKQTLSLEEFDVIVCDDSSTDETSDVLAKLASSSALNLRVMRTERNSGPARARNLASRSTAAPILAFVDDDCVPTPGWLEAGISVFDERDVGVVQGRTVPDPSVQMHRGVSQLITSFTHRYEACNIFYRRAVFEAVGGFDETIYFFGEDTVPGWGARRVGAGVRFAPSALAHHEVRRRGGRWLVRWALLHRNWPMLVRRYPEIRRELLWCRLFLYPRHAALYAAAAGIALATSWRPSLVLMAPALSRYFPWRFTKAEVVDKARQLGFDSLVMLTLIASSARNRTLVL